MTASERDLLRALALMCQQYLGEGLDHMCMVAGEEAIDQLKKYGLVEPHPGGERGGQWTDEGRRLLDE